MPSLVFNAFWNEHTLTSMYVNLNRSLNHKMYAIFNPLSEWVGE